MNLEQINQLIASLIDQIICLAEAQDVEFLKLTEKLHSHPIWGTTRKSVKNGDCSTVFHLNKLKELLAEQQKILVEEDKRLENIIQPNDHRPDTTHFISPRMPRWADKLPEKLDLGKRVRITLEGIPASHWEGTVTKHFVCGDDCGDWGRLRYSIQKDNGDVFEAAVRYCEILS